MTAQFPAGWYGFAATRARVRLRRAGWHPWAAAGRVYATALLPADLDPLRLGRTEHAATAEELLAKVVRVTDRWAKGRPA